MPAPPAFLDECVDHPTTEQLRQRGFDVLTAIEAGRAKEPDESQLAFATTLDRVLLTYNRMDFRRIHLAYLRAGRAHAGIIVIPQSSTVVWRGLRAAMMLVWLGESARQHSRLVQWNDVQQALIGGVRLPHFTEDEVREALGRM